MSKIPLYNFLRKLMRLLIWLLFFSPLFIVAQNSFDLNGQLMQQDERNGYGKLIAEDHHAAFCIGQSGHINAAYNYKGMKFHFSARDIRILGSASQLKFRNNFLSGNEVYFESSLINKWTVPAFSINDALSFQCGYSQVLFSDGLKII
ncbi:hypothetical protein ACKGJN_07270 [Gillisia sp. Q332]|uniref:hypothetical protein n=1 Tax=Gillisia xinjiangensis TaxID=3384765 RepID=UPI003919A0A9